MSNLPPGVTVGMIPGNRPEDIKWEQYMEAVEAKFLKWYGRGKYDKFVEMIDLIEASNPKREGYSTSYEIVFLAYEFAGFTVGIPWETFQPRW